MGATTVSARAIFLQVAAVAPRRVDIRQAMDRVLTADRRKRMWTLSCGKLSLGKPNCLGYVPHLLFHLPFSPLKRVTHQYLITRQVIKALAPGGQP